MFVEPVSHLDIALLGVHVEAELLGLLDVTVAWLHIDLAHADILIVHMAAEDVAGVYIELLRRAGALAALAGTDRHKSRVEDGERRRCR